jgi:hypothetical protein
MRLCLQAASLHHAAKSNRCERPCLLLSLLICLSVLGLLCSSFRNSPLPRLQRTWSQLTWYKNISRLTLHGTAVLFCLQWAPTLWGYQQFLAESKVVYDAFEDVMHQVSDSWHPECEWHSAQHGTAQHAQRSTSSVDVLIQ